MALSVICPLPHCGTMARHISIVTRSKLHTHSSGTSQHQPIPPALEMLTVSGAFHVTNKRAGLSFVLVLFFLQNIFPILKACVLPHSGAEPNTLEFEVALENTTEVRIDFLDSFVPWVLRVWLRCECACWTMPDRHSFRLWYCGPSCTMNMGTLASAVRWLKSISLVFVS
jgi:hypothetical protein